MRLGSLVAGLCALSATALADAEFASVRKRLRKDMSRRKSDPPQKYFHESYFHVHYDGRFADRVLNYADQKRALSNLVQAYLSTFADIGVETWLMHGSLLGWWWNKHIMPWDSDIDVQVMEPSMYYLAAYYNMSVFHYDVPRHPSGREGRDYLLEVNPNYQVREQTDTDNVVDARWIDTTTGLFIDITTARYNVSHPAGAGILSCKDGHEYRDTYLLPLHDTTFEGVPAKIPYRFRDMLESEYGPSALENKKFQDHTFDDDRMEWVPKISLLALDRLNE